MFARLTALVGSGNSLPFEVTGEPSLIWGSWTHTSGKWKADGSAVSVFRVASSNPSDPKLAAARNGTKRLRTLRHPNVLIFKETLELEEKGEQAIYLITEAIVPLAEFLESTTLTGTDRQEYLTMGFHALVAAVSFLNIDCSLIHGNICSGAIAVTPTLDWKLCGMDLLTEHAQVGPASPLAAAAWLVASQYKPGEVGRGEWEAVRAAPPWAVDAWGLGCLMQELYSGHALERLEDLRRTDVIPPSLVQWYQKLLSSTPARRLSPARLVESGVLRTSLVQLMAFLENLALKDSQEKDAFFKRLPSLLPSVPTPVAQRKLLPLLAGALEYGGAPHAALGTLLTIGETLPPEEQAARVVPIIAKLFAASDRNIRRGLLENIGAYGASLPEALVEEQIFSHVATGFTDGNPYLRELTLKSMVILGPKLSQKTLNQVLLKHLAKLQVDEEPSIRANTTVLLGTLATHLSEATCRKVLLNAFTRALRDGFPPARAAGLRAIIATAKFHSPEDAATRILPAIGPLCIDPVAEVRASALDCLEHFSAVLKAYQQDLTARAEASTATGGGPTASSSGAGSATAGGGRMTSLGWAASSLGLARAGAASPVPTAAGGSGQVGGPAAGGSGQVGGPAAGGSGSGAGARAAPAGPMPSERPRSSAAPPSPPDTSASARSQQPLVADEGWDEDDADGLAEHEEELAARRRLASASLRPAPRAPVQAKPRGPPSHVAAPAPSSGDDWFDQPAAGAAPRPRAALAPRRAAGTAAAAPRRSGAGGGMKLGVSKLASDAKPADFDEW
ncbi:hypothetical protein ACKKBG_A13815 [Auxenochlorella protothecoides x Auxenochlorella symbiontica]